MLCCSTLYFTFHSTLLWADMSGEVLCACACVIFVGGDVDWVDFIMNVEENVVGNFAFVDISDKVIEKKIF